MEEQTGNWFALENQAACALIADRAERRWLAPFIASELTIGAAAQIVNVSPTQMYKRVAKLLSLGLLRVTRTEPRAGKALRYFSAVSETFLIPFRVYPPDFIHAANRTLYDEAFKLALERLYREQRFVENDWAVRVAVAPSGDTYLQIVKDTGEVWDYLSDDAPAVASGWNPIWLEPDDAKALQREMVGLLTKYLGKRGSRAYLSGLFLCEAQTELGLSRPADHRPTPELNSDKIT